MARTKMIVTTMTTMTRRMMTATEGTILTRAMSIVRNIGDVATIKPDLWEAKITTTTTTRTRIILMIGCGTSRVETDHLPKPLAMVAAAMDSRPTVAMVEDSNSSSNSSHHHHHP